MKFLALSMILLTSLTTFAGNQYKLSQATCDGTPIDLTGGAENVKEFSYIIDLTSDTTANLNMMLKAQDQGAEFTVATSTPVKLNSITSDRYTMTANGTVSCTITAMGESYDCSDSVETSFPEEEFSMNKTQTTLTITFHNYTDEKASCNEMTMNFSKI